MIPTPPREPSPRPKEPTPECEQAYDAQRDGGVIQRPARDGVECWEAKHHGDEADPGARDDGHVSGRGAEVEGPALEIGGVDEGHGDGDAVGDVEADGGDGGGAAKGGLGA